MNNYEKKIEVEKGLKAHFEVDSFHLEVVAAGETEDKYEVNIEIRAANCETPEQFFTIDFNDEENTLKVSEQSKDKTMNIVKGIIKVTIPKETDVTVTAQNSAVHLTGIEGVLNVKSENGIVKIIECKGELNAENENGAIILKKSDGEVKLTTENGLIELFEGSGSGQISSENGQIRGFNTNFEKIEAKTENGSVYFEIPNIEKGSFNFISENGAVRLFIPAGLSFNLTAKNENGRLYFGLPDNYETSSEGMKKVIKAVRGSGKIQISAENENGSISIMADKNQYQQEEFRNKFKVNMGTFQGGFPFDKKEFKENLKRRMKIMVNKNADEINAAKSRSGINLNFNGLGDTLKEVFSHGKKDDVDDVNQGEDEDIVQANNTKDDNETNEMNASLEIQVLQMLEHGIINIDEAEKLIAAIKGEE